MIDLYNNKYDRQTLKDNIYAVKFIDILKTQKIDITFAVRYILNKKYQLHPEDEEINFGTVLKYQPHITFDSLYNAYLNYDSDNDSIPDFETVSNR
jgi:ribosomal protein S4E